jgi:hypothetical protein
MWDDEAMMKPTAHPPIFKKQVVAPWVQSGRLLLLLSSSSSQSVIPAAAADS